MLKINNNLITELVNIIIFDKGGVPLYNHNEKDKFPEGTTGFFKALWSYAIHQTELGILEFNQRELYNMYIKKSAVITRGYPFFYTTIYFRFNKPLRYVMKKSNLMRKIPCIVDYISILFFNRFKEQLKVLPHRLREYEKFSSSMGEISNICGLVVDQNE